MRNSKAEDFGVASNQSDYFAKLKDPRWQKRRLEVFARAGWCCEVCGEKSETLSVHHGLYRYGLEPWEVPEETLWCLCEGCHNLCQDRLADLKLELGRTNPKFYSDVMHAILAARELAGRTLSVPLGE